MTRLSHSVAMTAGVAEAMSRHLLRVDRQEDLCFAIWAPSMGQARRTALVRDLALPEKGERQVHGNASFNPEYVLRVASDAVAASGGVAFLHSHPRGRGWQDLSAPDAIAESRIANLVREQTGLPLLGMTLAGDGTWSARTWDRGAGRDVGYTWADGVRTVGQSLRVDTHPSVAPPSLHRARIARTLSAWSDATQRLLGQLHVVVVGAGSVGLCIIDSLARMGVGRITVLDFDYVQLKNLDRLRGARARDAVLRRSKAHVALRVLKEAAVTTSFQHTAFLTSVCEPEGMRRALDADVVFACVDRPWARHVLNVISYADLIPVIDGGLKIFKLPDGGMRNAYWRSTVTSPGLPCLACLRQYDPADVQLERDGSLDDPMYIAGLPAGHRLTGGENVSALSLAVAAAQLEQFVSLLATPAGLGSPGPLRYELAGHTVERDETVSCSPGCPYAASVASGDSRLDPSGRHAVAQQHRGYSTNVPLWTRAARVLDDALWRIVM